MAQNEAISLITRYYWVDIAHGNTLTEEIRRKSENAHFHFVLLIKLMHGQAGTGEIGITCNKRWPRDWFGTKREGAH